MSTPNTERFRKKLDNSPIATDGSSRGSPNLSFLRVLGSINPDAETAIRADLQQLSICEEFQHIPIIGVCGMMNSGKSTLVAHLLSPEGRQRVLIGGYSEEGTHRFVIWAPRSWAEDPGKRKELETFLKRAFDCEPELLSADPAEAAAQYNARAARQVEFGIPLLAFDEALDQHHLALLDCPDIQRSHDTSVALNTSHIRAEALAKAAKLCSAFFVVSTNEQQEDEKLRTFFNSLIKLDSQLPIYFVSTKVHLEKLIHQAAVTRNQLSKMGLDTKVRQIFISPNLADFPASGYPEGVSYLNECGEPQNLSEVCQHLDPSELQRSFVHEIAARLQAAVIDGASKIHDHQRENKRTQDEARSDVLKFLDNEFFKKGTLRPFYSPAVVLLLMESLERTAPWYLKHNFKLNNGFRTLKRGLASGWDWIDSKLPKLRRDLKKDHPAKGQKKLEEVGPDQFSHYLAGRKWVPEEANSQKLREIWESCINVIAHAGIFDEDAVRIELDEKMAEAWSEVSAWQKIRSAAGLPLAFAGIFAVILLAPIDFGGSAVLLKATLGELLAAAGLGALAVGEGAHSMDKTMEKRIAIPQHSALFSMIQDRFGIPRASTRELAKIPENKALKLVESPIAVKDALVEVLNPPVILVDNALLEQLTNEVPPTHK